MSEYCKGAQILGVLPVVGDTRDGVVVPVKEAGLYGRFEAGKDLNVSELARLMGALVGRAAVALV